MSCHGQCSFVLTLWCVHYKQDKKTNGETKLVSTSQTHSTIESRFEVMVVVKASLSPSWTKAMLQGGPRVSVIPCYRSWVGWPAQHSTALPNTEPGFCAEMILVAVTVPLMFGPSVEPSCADRSTVHWTQWSHRDCIQSRGSLWTFTTWPAVC